MFSQEHNISCPKNLSTQNVGLLDQSAVRQAAAQVFFLDSESYGHRLGRSAVTRPGGSAREVGFFGEAGMLVVRATETISFAAPGHFVWETR